MMGCSITPCFHVYSGRSYCIWLPKVVPSYIPRFQPWPQRLLPNSACVTPAKRWIFQSGCCHPDRLNPSRRDHHIPQNNRPSRRQHQRRENRAFPCANPVKGAPPPVDERAGGPDHGAGVEDESPHDSDHDEGAPVARRPNHAGEVRLHGDGEVGTHGGINKVSGCEGRRRSPASAKN